MENMHIKNTRYDPNIGNYVEGHKRFNSLSKSLEK